MSRKYPLELILRHTGIAELVDATDDTLWSSDSDADFKEKVSQEFLTEDDIDDVLDYLAETEILSDAEVAKFENGDFEFTEESLEEDDSDDDDDDDDVIADDDGDEY